MKLTVSRGHAVAGSRPAPVLGTATAAIALACSALAGAGTAAAASGPGGTATFLFRGVPRGIVATSAGNAWAVGCTTFDCYDKTDKPLILHWTGSTWRRQDPRPWLAPWLCTGLLPRPRATCGPLARPGRAGP